MNSKCENSRERLEEILTEHCKKLWQFDRYPEVSDLSHALHADLSASGFDDLAYVLVHGQKNVCCPKGGEHEWGTDGQHSNQFCKKCFCNKP